jgi:maltooligosyltrehalose trehalohydrolase
MNFNDQDVAFTPPAPSGNWQKILDSADTKWMGSGSTLPDKLTLDRELTIKPQSLALYEIAG